MGRDRPCDGLQAARGYDLHLARDQGRNDGAESRAIRGTVFRAGLAQGQGAGHSATGCGGVNQGIDCSGHGCACGV